MDELIINLYPPFPDEGMAEAVTDKIFSAFNCLLVLIKNKKGY